MTHEWVSQRSAGALADELDRRMRETCYGDRKPREQVRVSVGVAAYDPATDDSAEQVVTRADEAMHENKRERKGSRVR